MKIKNLAITVVLLLAGIGILSSLLTTPSTARDLASRRAAANSKSTTSLTLSSRNTVVINWVISSSSAAKAAQDVLSLSRNLDPKETIYLVLDTPGGSVDAGINFIQAVKSIPQNVVTISFFSASMGFQIAQGLGTRYVVPNGIMMSHLASGGVEGTIPGSANTTLQMWMGILGGLDEQAAGRMGLSREAYSKLIQNEYWTYGTAAVREGAADQLAQVKCDSSLQGTYSQEVETMFGSYNLSFSKCPLVRGVLGISRNSYGDQSPGELEMVSAIHAYADKPAFYRNYIKTNKYKEFGF